MENYRDAAERESIGTNFAGDASNNGVVVNIGRLTVSKPETLAEVLSAIGNPQKEDELKEIQRLYYIRQRIREEERKAALTQEETDVYGDESGKLDPNDDAEDSEFEMETENGNSSGEDEVMLGDGADVVRVPKRWPQPTPWILERCVALHSETADGSCKVYENGFASYTNLSGKSTVVWLGDCTVFEYRFVEVPGETMPSKSLLDAYYLGAQPWYIAVVLRGDYKIEHNRFCSQPDRDRDDSDDSLTKADREADGRPFRAGGFDNPERALLRKELFNTLMQKLSGIQRNVVIAYHIYGYNQSEVAQCMGKSKQAVSMHYINAKNILGDLAIDFLEHTPKLMEYCGQYADAALFERLTRRFGSKKHSYRSLRH